jgi:hypothetical protein
MQWMFIEYLLAWAPFTLGEYSAALNSLCPTGVYIRTRGTCNLFDLGEGARSGL